MSAKSVPQPRIGKGPGINFEKSNEKLNNSKETTFRILKYIGNKRLSLMLIFVFCVITTLVSIMGTKLNGDIVDKYISVGDISGLFRICIVLVFMYLVATLSTFIQNRLMVSIAQKTSAEIRKDLYEKMQHLPLKYFDTHSSGDLMSRLTNDIDNINMTMSQSITQLISGVINIVGMLIAMLMLNKTLTIIGLITTPITIFATKALIKYTQPFFVKKQSGLGELNGYIEEMVSGQKAVLLFSQEEKVKKEFSEINKKITKNSILAEAISGCMGPINNFINNLTYLILAICGGVFLLKGMDITVGVIFSIISNSLQGALAGAERVFEVMDEEAEVDKQDAIDVEKLDGEVKLENVDFSYNKNKKVLNKISLTAHKGQTIAIVGPTGSGKTTIINLLNKFYHIDRGTITIDGVDIDNITMESLRKSVAVVLQDTYLFSVSIRENLRYGNLNATDEEIIKAAKLANAHHFIMQLEDGYDTVLSDNGSNLSQGQRQLLAIARAILSKSSILILDEATSSIDTRTEVHIQNAMVNLMEGKTTFIIAHRLSTIRNADVILAVKDGEIIEKGTHDELLEAEGFYANLYNSQFRSGLSI